MIFSKLGKRNGKNKKNKKIEKNRLVPSTGWVTPPWSLGLNSSPSSLCNFKKGLGAGAQPTPLRPSLSTMCHWTGTSLAEAGSAKAVPPLWWGARAGFQAGSLGRSPAFPTHCPPSALAAHCPRAPFSVRHPCPLARPLFASLAFLCRPHSLVTAN